MTPAVAAFRETLIQEGLLRPDMMLTATNLPDEIARLQRLTALAIIARRVEPALKLDATLRLEQIHTALDRRFSLRAAGIHRFKDLLAFLDRTRVRDELRAAVIESIPDVVLDLPPDFAHLQPTPTRVHRLLPIDLTTINTDTALNKDTRIVYERWITRTLSSVRKHLPWLAGTPPEMFEAPFPMASAPPLPDALIDPDNALDRG